MPIAQVTVVPIGTGDAGVASYVKDVLAVLDGYADLDYVVGANGTVVEGDLDLIFAAVREMHERPFAAGAQRVMTLINIDDRRDKPQTMKEKVARVVG
jgi:uncharacterized protein (TIGR00106 family)